VSGWAPEEDGAFRDAADGVGDGPGGIRRITLTQVSTVEPESVRWLWDGRVPLGALSLIAGQPGLGKSTTTIHLAAQLSRGALEGALYGEPCDVLFVTLEDHIASVVRPRLGVADADLSRVHVVGVQEDGHEGLLTLPDDLVAIEERARHLSARLLVIDPIVATLGSGTDSHKDQSVRRALAPLAQYAERADVAVIGVMHMTKAEADGLLNRVAGSVAFGGAARSVFAFARDPEDPDGEAGYNRLLVHAKSNWGRYARSLQCRIDAGTVETRNGSSEQSLLTVLGECDVTGADLSSGGEPGELEDAIEFLEGYLADGEWHQKREVKKATDAQRLAWRTVQRAAKGVSVEYEKQGFPAVSMWRLTVAPSTSGATGGATVLARLQNGSVEPNLEGLDSSRARHGNDGATGENGTRIEVLATPEQEAVAARLLPASEGRA
jgi:AAA domain